MLSSHGIYAPLPDLAISQVCAWFGRTYFFFNVALVHCFSCRILRYSKFTLGQSLPHCALPFSVSFLIEATVFVANYKY